MSYIYYNANPDGKNVGDCVIRAIATVMDEAKSEYERQTVMNTIHRIRSEI